MSSFNRNIPFPDNPNFINVEGQGLTLIENDQKLKGNLENVDEKNLLKVQPKDLKVGERYLLMNNKTNEKTVASYKDYSEDEYNDFFYTFQDKDGELEIKATNISNYDDTDDSDDNTIEDPYSPLLSFDTNFSVYMPQTKKIMKKILDEKLPEDVSKEINSYLNYGGKFKKKSKKNKKSLKKSNKRRIKKTIKSKRRIKKTIKSKKTY